MIEKTIEETDKCKGYIDAVQVSAIAGIECEINWYDVYRTYIGQDTSSINIYLNNTILEEACATYFTKETGIFLKRPMYPYIDANDNKLRCSVDFEGFFKNNDGSIKTIGVKVCVVKAKKNYDEWYDETKRCFKVPPKFIAACQWYYHIANFDEVYTVRLSEDSFSIHSIARDTQLINHLVSRVNAFTSKIATGWIPAPLTIKQCKNIYQETNNTQLEADEKILDTISKYNQLKEQTANLRQQLEEKEVEIRNYLKTNSAIVSNNKTLAIYTISYQNKFDIKACANEKPEIYKEFLKQYASKTLKTS